MQNMTGQLFKFKMA